VPPAHMAAQFARPEQFRSGLFLPVASEGKAEADSGTTVVAIRPTVIGIWTTIIAIGSAIIGLWAVIAVGPIAVSITIGVWTIAVVI
jgi:hypothetical protein